MPHYKDGTPAEIGDHVKGIPYNTGGKEVVGTLIQITEDTDSRNCIVAFVDAEICGDANESTYRLIPLMKELTIVRGKGGRVTLQGSIGQEILTLRAKFDYGAVKDFVKV